MIYFWVIFFSFFMLFCFVGIVVLFLGVSWSVIVFVFFCLGLLCLFKFV